MVMHEAARYGCFPRLIFSPNLSVKRSAFLGKPTWSPKTKRGFGFTSMSAMVFPPSSST